LRCNKTMTYLGNDRKTNATFFFETILLPLKY
jgi:hypothetical protein